MQKEFLDTRETSELTGISKSTLEKWRLAGGRIPFIRAGRSVKYAVEDVRDWMAQRRVMSTSEHLPAEPPPPCAAERAAKAKS